MRLRSYARKKAIQTQESSIIGVTSVRMISAFFMIFIIEKPKKFAKEKKAYIISYMNPSLIIILFLSVLFLLYAFFFYILRHTIKKEEWKILDIFGEKVSKIPAFIEVMRPYVVDESAFSTLIELHTDAIIREYTSIYHLLEHNARIQREITFLLELSAHIPLLQKHEYFLYIRDFIVHHELSMRKLFTWYNHAIKNWNRFISIKNMILIGYILPGKKLMQI